MSQNVKANIVTSNVSDVAQSLRGYISVTCGRYKSIKKGRIDKRDFDKSIKDMQKEFNRFVDALLA